MGLYTKIPLLYPLQLRHLYIFCKYSRPDNTKHWGGTLLEKMKKYMPHKKEKHMEVPHYMEHDPCYPMHHGHYHHGGYGYDCDYGYGYGNTFAIIVVLFILLIIVGAAAFHHGGKGKDC